jgi:hypothetical protein
MHQIYHTEFTPLPPTPESFNRVYFSIYIHVCTVFAPYSLFYTLSPPHPLSHWYLFHPHRTWSALLFSNFVEEKSKKNDILLI